MRSSPPATRSQARFEITSGTVGHLGVTGLVLGVALYVQANLLFWAFGLLVGALLISLLLSYLMMRRLSVERIAPSHGVAGEALLLRYRVINGKRWIPVFGLVVQETWGSGRNAWKSIGPIAQPPQRLRGRPHGWVLHLGPGQAAQAEAPCWPIRRGPLNFERIILSTSFPFGIIRRVSVVQEHCQVLVYPHLYRINRRVLVRLSQIDPHGRKRLDRGGGHEEFFGLRAYRSGDSLKTVDWKRSAKTGDLISREMTLPAPPKIMVVLDLTHLEQLRAEMDPVLQKHRGRNPALEADAAVERAVSLAASIVCDAYFNGYQVGLAVEGVRFNPVPLHHSLPHRTRMLEALARLDVLDHCDDRSPLPAPPTVIIRPGAAQTTPRLGGPMIFGAEEMDKYVADAEGGSLELLGRRSAHRQSRRELLRGGEE